MVTEPTVGRMRLEEAPSIRQGAGSGSGRVRRHPRTNAIVVAVCLIAAGLVAAAPSGAEPVTKTLSASCKGRSEADKGALTALGQSAFPITITSDVPARLEPNQSGSPISFEWTVILDVDLVNVATGLNVREVVVKGARADISVAGPTSTKLVPSGTIPDIPVSLVAGQEARIGIGTYRGTLEDVGDAGTITYSPANLGFTIDIPSQQLSVSVDCSTGTSRAATTQIKVPGSPDLVQPIEERARPGEQLTIDVLGRYVAAGTTKDGRVLEVDPTSLVVVDGPGSIVDGRLQVTAGPAGTSTSVGIRVCAKEQIAGADEVQTLTIDPSSDALKKGIALTVRTKAGTSAPIDLMSGTNFLGLPVAEFQTFTPPDEGEWVLVANQYIPSTHRMPTAAEVQAVLEATPGIGPGNVEVTNPTTGAYDVKFVNALGQRNVDLLAIGDYWSVFPQELLDEIIDAAGELLPEPGATTTTLPGGATPEQYRRNLRAGIQAAVAALNLELAGRLVADLLAFELDQALSNIDAAAAISALTSLFTEVPTVTDTLEGVAPTGICTEGVVDVVVDDVLGATTVPPGDPGGLGDRPPAGIAFTG